MNGPNLNRAPSLGPIVYASAFGKPLIILNSFAVAQDLLQKRGSIYSGRPRLITFSEMWDHCALRFLSSPFTYPDVQDGMGTYRYPDVWRA